MAFLVHCCVAGCGSCSTYHFVRLAPILTGALHCNYVRGRGILASEMQKANQAQAKPFDASGWRLGIVVAEFNKHITDKLLSGALKRAASYKLGNEKIDIIKVAGSVEIPLVLAKMAATKKYDALLAMGCVIKGETPHFDYVCKFVTEGVLRVQLDHFVPVGFGVLTCNNEEQALARAHLGSDFLDAVLSQANSIKQFA